MYGNTVVKVKKLYLFFDTDLCIFAESDGITEYKICKKVFWCIIIFFFGCL